MLNFKALQTDAWRPVTISGLLILQVIPLDGHQQKVSTTVFLVLIAVVVSLLFSKPKPKIHEWPSLAVILTSLVITAAVILRSTTFRTVDLLFRGDDQSSFLNCVGRVDLTLPNVQFCEGGTATYHLLVLMKRIQNLKFNLSANKSLQALSDAWLFLLITFFALLAIFLVTQIKKKSLPQLVVTGVVTMYVGAAAHAWIYDKGYLSAGLCLLFLNAAFFFIYLWENTDEKSSSNFLSYAIILIALAALSWYPIALIAISLIVIIFLYTLINGTLDKPRIIVLIASTVATVLSFAAFVPDFWKVESVVELASVGEQVTASFASWLPLKAQGPVAILSVLVALGGVVKACKRKKINISFCMFLLLGVFLVLEYLGMLGEEYIVAKIAVIIQMTLFIQVPILISQSRNSDKSHVLIKVPQLMLLILLPLTITPRLIRPESPPIAWYDYLLRNETEGLNLCYIANSTPPFSYQLSSYLCSKWFAASTGKWNSQTADWAQGLYSDDRSPERMRIVTDLMTKNSTTVIVDVPIETMSSLDKFVLLSRQHAVILEVK